nr:PREDICTED: uncharacterized protein LOC107398741 [Tribolium castaneum]|eukprot:XP_015839412.1 PREDICTED: uncharacterized protein LOC107398741 [Tribolium castaneum]
MTISESLFKDFLWWEANIGNAYCPIRKNNYIMEIFTDASASGWGAYSKGQGTHGFWDSLDKKEHINFLELKAVFFGLRCFAAEAASCNILLRIDNTTAVAYINRMGSIKYPKLASLSRKIWQCRQGIANPVN